MKRYITVNIILTYEVFRVNNLYFRKRYRQKTFRNLHKFGSKFCCKMPKAFPADLSFFSFPGLL